MNRRGGGIDAWWFGGNITRGSKYDRAMRPWFMDPERALRAVTSEMRRIGRDMTDEEVIDFLIELGEPGEIVGEHGGPDDWDAWLPMEDE